MRDKQHKLMVIVGLPLEEAASVVKDDSLKSLLNGSNVALDLREWRKAAANLESFQMMSINAGESWIGFEVATIPEPCGLEKEDISLETLEACIGEFGTLFACPPRIALAHVGCGDDLEKFKVFPM